MTRDQHSVTARSFRPDPTEYDTAVTVLTIYGHMPGEFLRACLRWLGTDPTGAMTVLRPHWPTPRPVGRPADRDRADR